MIITNSEKPVTVAVGAHGSNEAYSFTVPVNSVEQHLLLDSNGAGDTFVGGFLASVCLSLKADPKLQLEGAVLSKDHLTQAVRAGNLIAGQVVQRYGCDFPTLPQLKRLIEDSQSDLKLNWSEGVNYNQ